MCGYRHSSHVSNQADCHVADAGRQSVFLSLSLPFFIFFQPDWLILRVSDRLASALILSYTSPLE